LLSRIFRPLATPLRAVDDKPRLRFGSGVALGKVTGVPLGTNAESIQRYSQDRQQPLNPMVGLKREQGR
jgi:hypothetical protein